MGKNGFKRILLILLLITSLMQFLVSNKLYCGTSHNVIGSLKTSFGTIPSASTLSFTAYIVGRSSDLLYETSGGCGYDESVGAWYVNCGNFSASWAAGEVLHIEFTDSETDETGSDNVTLTDNFEDNGGTTTLTAPAETVSEPNTPSGDATAKKGQSKSYTVNGGSSSLGHPLEYQFDWGDGSQSAWGSGVDSHTYTSTGTFQVKARVRCDYHDDKVSAWSSALSVTVSQCNLTVNVSPGGSGNVTKSPDKAGYDYNEVVQLTAAGTGAYSFSYWEGGGLSGSDNPKNLTMDGDKTVTAYFALETVSVPTAPSGPSTGFKGQSLTYTTGGSVNNFGHPVEYQFDWGDGNFSVWVASGTESHTYTAAGTFQVRAYARCQTHTSVVSGPSTNTSVTISLSVLTVNVDAAGTATVVKNPDKAGYDYNENVQLTVNPAAGYGFDHWGGALSGNANPANITMNGNKSVTAYMAEETVSAPNQPSGPGTGFKGQSLSYTTSGGASSFGHDIEYQFDWGDGIQSTWGYPSGSHTYAAIGTYSVKARARCQIHMDKVSPWSTARSVVIGMTNLTITINPVGGGTVAKNPDKAGYDWNESVQLTATPADARFRFLNYTGDLMGSVNPQSLAMTGNKSVTANFEQETVSAPTTPAGPSLGMVAQVLAYTTSGSVSSFGHEVEYRFNWGDGTYSNWGTGSASHSYSSTGVYQVRAQARCKLHTDILSNWSNIKSVSISTYTLTLYVDPAGSGSVTRSPSKVEYNPGETVNLTGIPSDGSYRFDHWSGDLAGNSNPSSIIMNSDKTVTAHFEREIVYNPTKAYGPSELYMGQSGTYVSQGTRSTFLHELEYRFDWGDGNISPWGPIEQAHAFDTTGVYHVVSMARCKQHPQVTSGWSEELRYVWVYGCSLSISIDPVGSGHVERTPSREAYLYQSQVELAPVANSGYLFSHWSGHLSGSTTPAVVVMDTLNRNITAHFRSTSEVVTVPLTLTGPDSGAMGLGLEFTASGSSSNQGYNVEYQFEWGDGSYSEWGNGTSLHAYASTGTKFVRARARSVMNPSVVSAWSASHAVVIYAYFLTVQVEPAAAGIVSIDPQKNGYAAYEIITLTPQGNHGYGFEHWSGDASGTARPLEIVMSRDKTIVAHFVEMNESISKPDPPQGPEQAFRNQLLMFLAGGAFSTIGSELEYQYEWGDGTFSDWGDGTEQMVEKITRYTSPNGYSGLLSMGYLVDYATGGDTDVLLRVTGGVYDLPVHSKQGAEPAIGTDAHIVFNGKINSVGSIFYVDQADSALVFELQGLDPDLQYTFVFYSNIDDYGWDQASLVTISDVASFTNLSSIGADNQGYLLYDGATDPSVKLPSANTHTGYVAKFSQIQSGPDGDMRITVTSAGSAGNEGKGKYANALMLQAINPATSSVVFTAYNDCGWGDEVTSHRFTDNGTYRLRCRARAVNDTTIMSEWSSYFNLSISGCYMFTAEVPYGAGLVTRFPSKSDYLYGEVVMLNATPVSGYWFDHWNDDPGDSSANRYVVMDDNKTFVGHFRDATSVRDYALVEKPTEFQLLQNYPNPFNPETTIRFQLPGAEHVRVTVYNMNGQLVSTLVDAELTSGYHSVVWHATDATGNGVPSGVYLYRIEAGSYHDVKKMILMR